jgi:glyoxylase-like metal-dependent hydrolase (beta-lactamase superfamily II)
MHYKKFVLGPLETNSYVLYAGTDAYIIDPVVLAEEMGTFIQQEGLKVQAIIATHSHVDHIYDARETADYHHVPVYMNNGAEKLRDIFADSCLMLGFESKEMVRDYKNLDAGTQITLGEERLEVLQTPGHSPCGISLRTADILVTGDLLFKGSIGRYDLPHASMVVLYNSLKKVKALPDSLKILPGHGPESELGEEKRTNEFLITVND